MFLSCCSPVSSKLTSSLPCASSCTRPETQMPPGSASASKRAAMFTPSPQKSAPSMMSSPKLMPMRNSMRLPNGTGIPFNHAALDLDGAPQRVYHACELDQQPVTDNSNDAPVVFLYCRLDK